MRFEEAEGRERRWRRGDVGLRGGACGFDLGRGVPAPSSPELAGRATGLTSVTPPQVPALGAKSITTGRWP